MCGIYGIIFHSTKHVERPMEVSELFSMLACESSIRGLDATGMAVVRDTGVTNEYRNNQPAYAVIGYRRWWQNLQALETPALAVFGHTRWGTHGANTVENAHPFLFKEGPHGELCGTHNGQITNHQDFGPAQAFDNDSRNLFHGLSRVPKAKWARMLKQVRGSYALAFSTPGAFHLARNYGSPCFMAYCADFDATVYASTADILQSAVLLTKVRVGKMSPLRVGELRTYRPNQRKYDTVIFQPQEVNAWKKHFGEGVRKVGHLKQCDGCDELVEQLTYFAPRSGLTLGYLCRDCVLVYNTALTTKWVPAAPDNTVPCYICKEAFPKSALGQEIRYQPRWGALVCDLCNQGTQTGLLPLPKPSYTDKLTQDMATAGKALANAWPDKWDTHRGMI